MRKRKLKRLLERRFGAPPDLHYFHGDMEYIRAYSDFRRDTRRDAFWIDDVTWNDLNMDGLFKRINPGLSTSGEQYLYHMLRAPAVDEPQFADRKALIELMGANADLRLKLQLVLARLGNTRRADLCGAFSPAAHGYAWLFFYLFLFLLVPASLIAISFAPKIGILTLAGTLFFNSILHELRIHRTQRDFDLVNYAVGMAFAARRIRKLRDPRIDAHMQAAYQSLGRLRSVIRTGSVSSTSNDPFADSIVTMLLLDLIAYEFLKNKLGRCQEDVFAIHEQLGRIDAAIAVASYRKSLGSFAEPQIDFGVEAAFLDVRGMRHPLMDKPVPNDAVTASPMLVTGSNASGKSTFLKTAILSAIMAQGICTCTADGYRASAFRIFSSMALSDDLSAGESYYIVEIKSLKRIFDAARGKPPVLCAIDEVLRGTNTVERIAASSAFLAELAALGVLCLAATHDIELCALLKGEYRMFHFEETVTEDGMKFDYRLRDGSARSRNAINLLKLLGFDDAVVERAHERANRYLDEGAWK